MWYIQKMATKLKLSLVTALLKHKVAMNDCEWKRLKGMAPVLFMSLHPWS